MRASIRSWPRFAAGLAVAGIIVVGCGGGGGGEGAATAPVTAPPAPPAPPVTGNTPPEITGTPKVTTVVGQEYSFQPQATDADSDPISFTVRSKPSWAQFDTATGRLWGTATAADVGVHENIEVTASDGKDTSALPPFAVIVSAPQTASKSISIGWDAPTENDDGTPLTDLAGFHVYYGNAAQQYAGTIEIATANTVQHVMEDLPAGTYYFVITAMNSEGLESVYSTEVNATVN